jgi:sugar-specific transcriptional regulator TrmB
MNDTGDNLPTRRLITSRGEYLEAVDQLLPMARREIRIFDPDLADLRLHIPERIAQLREFLVQGRHTRIYIALHKTEFVEQRAPRLMQLLGLFSANMVIQRTQGDATRVEDCFILVDELHVARRPVAAQPRGVVLTHDENEAARMRERFDHIWESSEPGVSAVTSGL